MSTTATYLKTLRRIPDDIVLSMATREIIPESAQCCICGWAVREAVARAANVDAEDTQQYLIVGQCAERFGGEWLEWQDVFSGIINFPERIERAFVTRVMEAAGVAAP